MAKQRLSRTDVDEDGVLYEMPNPSVDSFCDDTDDEFDAGQDGYYTAEHAHFYIEEIEG